MPLVSAVSHRELRAGGGERSVPVSSTRAACQGKPMAPGTTRWRPTGGPLAGHWRWP
jgi:hypothetical protein